VGKRKISIEKNKEKIYKNIFVYFYLLIFYSQYSKKNSQPELFTLKLAVA